MNDQMVNQEPRYSPIAITSIQPTQAKILLKLMKSVGKPLHRIKPPKKKKTRVL